MLSPLQEFRREDQYQFYLWYVWSTKGSVPSSSVIRFWFFFKFKNLLALNNYIHPINIFRCFSARIGPETLTPPFWLKRFPQCWQMWGFSPVWSFMWFLREPGFASSLGQTVHCTCQRSTELKRSFSTILKYHKCKHLYKEGKSPNFKDLGM